MSKLQRTAGADEVDVVISISNGEIAESAKNYENPDCHTETRPEVLPLIGKSRDLQTAESYAGRGTSGISGGVKENLQSSSSLTVRNNLEEHIAMDSSDIKSYNKNSPGNESASSIRTNSTNPKTPLMTSPRRPEDDADVGEIIKMKILKRRHWNIRTTDVFQWALNFSILGCLVAFRIVEKLGSKKVWDLQLWEWCVFGMAIFWGKLLVNWLIHFIVFLIEKNFMLRKQVLYFVVGLKNSIQVIAWMVLVLITWKYLLDHRTGQSQTATRILKYVTRTIISTLVGSFLFLLKRLWLLVLAYGFQVNALFDKIQETIFHQYILRTLSGPPLAEEEAEKIGRSPSFTNSKKDRKMWTDYFRLTGANVSSWTMKVLADQIRNSALSISGTLDESIDAEDTEICSQSEATAAAYRIFKNVAKPGSKYIYEEDLSRFLFREEVYLVFTIFYGYEAGRIDRKSFTSWVIRAYNSRKMLAHSINDIESIIEQVNRVVTWILVVVVIILWIILMEFIKLDVIVLLLSAAAFMLGNPFKSLFDAIIFVFVVHPFDVGDRCVVDGIELVVEEMNILTTVFLKPNNEKVLYPNSVLATKPISNYYRSPDMGDAVEFSIDYGTPKLAIKLLKERIKQYLENSPHWHSVHNIVVKDVENVNKINMILYCSHNINFQELGEKNKRRAELFDDIIKMFEDLNIKFYNIHCSDKFASQQYLENSPHWHSVHSTVVKDVENVNKINMILYCSHNINFQELGEKNKRRAELFNEIIKLFEELNIKFYNIRYSDKLAAGIPSQQ